MSSIALKSLGPIDYIVFDFPDGRGGVKVLKGTSGVGKSTALRALRGLIGDKDAVSGITPHDGQEKGEVSGFGRTLKIGSRVTTTGSANVPHLSGKLDMSTLVEPKVADPAARTKARVRWLVSIGGKQVTVQDLLGDKYEDYADRIDIDEIASADDPVALADKLKRALDRLALDSERDSDRKAGFAQAKRQEAGDVDQLSKSLDYSAAVENHRAAMLAAANAKSQRDKHFEATARNASVQEQLRKLAEEPADDIAAIQQAIETSKKTIEGLRSRLEAATAILKANEDRLENAIKRERVVSQLESLRVEVGESVSDETISELQAKENEALEALNAASSVDVRKQALAESIEAQNEAADLAQEALQCRAIAQMVLEKVQQALPSGPIQIKDGTLVVQQGKRSKYVPFEEFSTGEKWRVALPYAIAAVGEGGLILADQEAWQALGPELKQEITEICADAKVWLVTGEVSDGELRIEEFTGSESV